MLKLFWMTNEEIEEQNNIYKKFKHSYIMGTITLSNNVVLNTRIYKIEKYPILVEIDTLFHEFVHLFNIKIIDDFIDWIVYIKLLKALGYKDKKK